MTDTLCQFLTWAVRDVIFFSGDVQTTTIAMAITSSLCCSIVVAVVHVVALILPRQQKSKSDKKCHRSFSSSSFSKKSDSPMWMSSGKVYVPCVKCGKFFADDGCRFVTCKTCCFAVLSCHVHQRKSLSSKPCDPQQTEIDLSSVGMQSCPERLGFVGAQLTCLNLSNNELQDLPAEIGCLRGLQHLSLSQNKLNTLPTTLGSLSQLVSFNISQNLFEKVPECVGCLTSLQELDMSCNQLTSLPAQVSKLTNLVLLDTSNNQIEVLTEELFNLFQLQVLVLKSNPIQCLPDSIQNLVKLNVIDLQSCHLTCLPPAIGHCTKLSCLKLDNNRLRELPPQVGQLRNLQHLLLDNNRLQHLPAMLAFLPDTLTVSVRGNPLLPHTDFCKLSYTPDKGPSLFPSLKELTARVIIKRNIPNTSTLPNILQDMLKSPGYCSKCGGPLFDFYSSKILPWHFLFGNVAWIPLFQQLCSPHQPQGCG